MKRLVLACAVVALAVSCSEQPGGAQKDEGEHEHAGASAPTAEAVPAPAAAAQATPEAVPGNIPSGDYKIDKAHASLIFRVNHVGFSNWTAQFMEFDATLKLDAKNPAASTLTATIETASLMINTPPEGFMDTLLSEKWLSAAKFPQMTFRSTKIEMTGEKTARVTGELSLKGATKPVTLDVTFNGGYAGHPYEPAARIGFSAKGSLKRTDFGVSEGVPAPGSTIGVSDAVEILIEAEFNGPPLKAAPPAPPPPAN